MPLHTEEGFVEGLRPSVFSADTPHLTGTLAVSTLAAPLVSRRNLSNSHVHNIIKMLQCSAMVLESRYSQDASFVYQSRCPTAGHPCQLCRM